MSIAIFSHPSCLEHDTGPGHPENAGRLTAIMNALRDCDYAENLDFLDAPPCEDAYIAAAHSEDYLEKIRALAPEDGSIYLDGGDTVMSPGSLEAAYRAAGAGCAAVDAVSGGSYETAFCPVRPPGHHATRQTAMGFCIFNNIAIAALYALEHKGYERVAIVDYDVHHGNGTQDIMTGENRCLYVSTHQSPFYPGTGREDERTGDNIVNVELPSRIESAAYRKAFSERVLPALEKFRPELLFISAGFDAHVDDPLAQVRLTDEDYGWIGSQLCNFAINFCHGKSVSMLEGGYDHAAISRSAVAFLAPFV